MANLEKFKKLSDLQSNLKETSSLNKKRELLEEYKKSADSDFSTKIFNYISNPHIRFYVTSENVLKSDFNGSAENVSDDMIMHVLEMLSERNVTGNAAIELCAKLKNGLANIDESIANLFLNIIDKDFSCGVSTSTIESVFGLKSQDEELNFGVALANKYFDRADKVDFTTQDWWASRKCDGVRCIAIKKDGKVKFYSRQQKEFLTLGVLKKILENVPEDNFALDGELCIVDLFGNEDFISIVKLVRRKDFTITNPFYQVFDKLTLNELYNGGGRVLSERLVDLRDFCVRNNDLMEKNIKMLKQTRVENMEVFNDLYDEAKSNNWEGLMIRRDVCYEGKRTNNLLKVKDFMDAEFEVIGYEVGEMRFNENGKQVTRNVLTNVTIDYKGNKVGVGSGFSKQERVHYAEHPEDIVGHIITVKYFEETTNQKGGASMRFPTVKCVYENSGRLV